MIGMTLVGKPGTRALTVAEADDDGVALALTVGDAVSVAEAEGVVTGEDVDCAVVVPASEQPARSRAAMATTGMSRPRRFLNRVFSLDVVSLGSVSLGTVTRGTVTRILRTCSAVLPEPRSSLR